MEIKARMHAKLISFVMTASIVWVGGGCGNQEQQGRCVPGICSDHGQCVDNGESVVCVCDTGYAGNQCQVCETGYFEEGNGTCAKADVCQPDSCNHHGECLDDGGNPECVCHRGYTGTSCQDCDAGFHDPGDGTCVPDNVCGPDSCNGHGVCDDSGQGIVCNCDPAYAGETCERCATGYHPDGSDCVADARCQANSCSGHGECNDSGGIISCTCDPGYAGETCDGCADGFHTSIEGICVPDELCQPDSCSAKGACDDSTGEIVCTCDAGYAGLECERCAAGYHEDGSGVCLPDQTCGANTCNGHGACDDSTGTISCACEPGYTGPHCESCEEGFQDNDQNGTCLPTCAAADLDCGPHGSCQDAGGVAVCTCSTGYSGVHCEACDNGYQDEDSNGSCLPTCATAGLDCGAHGECSHASGVARCECETGYTGGACQTCASYYQDNDGNGTCLPDCALANLDCGAHGECRDASGLALCVCDTGYTGSTCQTCASNYQDNDGDGTCLPTCSLSGLDCGAHGQCDDATGVAHCSCDMGYQGNLCQSCAAGFHPEGNLCLPDDAWCGNGYVDGHEECDGAADSACPGHCSAHCACPAVSSRNRLEIHMIDVGQGDAILVVSPDGFVMLVDAGNDWDSGAILQYLDDEGIGSLDYTLVSHMHADHLGGMDGVLGDLPTVACFDNGGSYYTGEYDAYDEAAGDRRVMLDAGDTIDMGPSVQVDVLHGHTGDYNENLNSVVVRVTYGSTRVLLGGDCEAECEDDFDPGPIDLYKVHHHGSSDSSSESLLSQMEPELALIPVGYANPYGHPHSYTLDRLSAHGVTVYRTDLNGDIEVHCDGQYCTPVN